MTRAFRWQVWVPRVLLLGVGLLACQLALALVARSIAIQSLESSVGGQVEVEHARVALNNRTVVFGNLQFTLPAQPLDSAVAADFCELKVAAAPLLHKQVIVEEGRMYGVRLGLFGGDLPAQATRQPISPSRAWFRSDGEKIAAQWFSHLAEQLHADRTAQLESAHRIEAFLASWSAQSAILETSGQELVRQAGQIERDHEAAEANPLRSSTFLTGLPQLLADVQKKCAAFLAQLEQQSEHLETERRAIVAARRRDEQHLGNRLPLETVDAQAISAYLLQHQAARTLGDLDALVKWIRGATPAAPANKPAAQRGEDILFAGCRAQPNVLIRTLEIEGSARIASQPVEFRGLLTDCASSPVLHSEPMRLRLRATGSLPLELQATFDRTNGAVRDTILVDAQGILLPAASLGQPDQVRLTVGPSLGALSISLTLDRDRLDGEIQMVQRDVQLTSVLGAEFADLPVASIANEPLAKLNSIATRVSVSGTLSQPKCVLWSNLGPALVEALEQAVQRAGQQRGRALLADASQRGDEKLTMVERQATEQRSRWSGRITHMRAKLQAVAAAEGPDERSSPARVGTRLPANSLFR